MHEEYYEGEFSNNMRHGQGKMINGRLELAEGIWESGKFKGEKVTKAFDRSYFDAKGKCRETYNPSGQT